MHSFTHHRHTFNTDVCLQGRIQLSIETTAFQLPDRRRHCQDDTEHDCQLLTWSTSVSHDTSGKHCQNGTSCAPVSKEIILKLCSHCYNYTKICIDNKEPSPVTKYA